MNSLATQHEADTYLEYSLKKRVWNNFQEQMSALVSATRIIMNLPLKQATLTELTDYLNEVENSTIPEAIKEACIEIALALADGIDPEMEYRQLTKTTQGYGPLRQTKDTTMVEQYLAVGVPSLAAWTRLIPYLNIADIVVLERVS
jgi:hypothetical protein